jgi:C-terminal processing protease CtpA/Prc
MQDSNIATVFGEDKATSGALASVSTYEDMKQNFKWRFYKPLPYPQSMTVGITMSVRANGKMIENVGVVSDQVVLPTREDVLYPAKSATQFDRIADVLRDVGIKTGKSKLYCKSSPHQKSI